MWKSKKCLAEIISLHTCHNNEFKKNQKIKENTIFSRQGINN
jgi:hypothetical protein